MGWDADGWAGPDTSNNYRRHPREGGDLGWRWRKETEVPAFAGMTRWLWLEGWVARGPIPSTHAPGRGGVIQHSS